MDSAESIQPHPEIPQVEIPRPDIASERETVEWVLEHIHEPYGPYAESVALSKDPNAAQKALIQSQTELIISGTVARSLPPGSKRDEMVDEMVNIAKAQAKPETTSSSELSPTDQAKLEGVHLTGRAIAHEFNNKTALAVGTLDMISEDPSIPTHYKEMAKEGLEGLSNATKVVTQIQGAKRIAITETPVGSMLNIEASSIPAPRPQSKP